MDNQAPDELLCIINISANRLGYDSFNLSQLKIIQEATSPWLYLLALRSFT
jgi:uncharacterized protein (DUF486 family)